MRTDFPIAGGSGYTAVVLRPIGTALGIPKGRDSIYLAAIQQAVCPREITFSGNIEGLIETASVPFALRFHGLLELHAIELDFSDAEHPTSLVEVMDSERVATLKARDHSAKVKDHRHFIFATYDEVFAVICAGYELTLGEPVAHLLAEDDEDDI